MLTRARAEVSSARAKLREALDAVGLAERLPREPIGEHREPREVREAADRVVRSLELEEERCARLEIERPRGRAPKLTSSRSAWPASVWYQFASVGATHPRTSESLQRFGSRPYCSGRR